MASADQATDDSRHLTAMDCSRVAPKIIVARTLRGSAARGKEIYPSLGGPEHG
jgi:hypothetical protein